MKTKLDITLRSTELIAELTIQAPEYDVGLIGPWWEDLTLFDQSGTQLNWALSEKEMSLISAAVNEHYYSLEDSGESYFNPREQQL